MYIPQTSKTIAMLSVMTVVMHFPAYAAEQVPETHIISPNELPSYIKTFNKRSQRNRLSVEGESCVLSLNDLSMDDDNLYFDATCDGKNILFKTTESLQPIAEGIVLTYDDLANDKWSSNNQARVKVSNDRGGNVTWRGTLFDQNEQRSKAFKLQINESLIEGGYSDISVKGDSATLSGVLGTKTYIQMQALIQQHPNVTTLEFGVIDGSINDAINMHTGRLIRHAGLNTYIPKTGEAYSGGVDLFAAGVQRQFQTGATLGVHSWCCEKDQSAHLLKPSDKAHWPLLTYSNEMLEKGTEFYFYTINAASADDIHIMAKDELTKFNLVTEFIK
ncbi:hypothetical protein VIOR3934_14767 [Vibrio orientalis CIP 102891 = ATCC 33934]|uniref:Alpha/beta hydrolase n=1 Tax=Vibrio orientalis CIP 102891 = ATCC 33934 TaxID=675816 RepID=F9SVT0_VIBOR|nr:hypothetical protein [Vibrio orientalis]EGU48382.1 hypothetical protein VIOR3934_14767 [Vibrio orientalis CIP 102891 = ATCC 33934]